MPETSVTREICYAASKPGWPGYFAIMVDDGNPAFAKDTARTRADWVKAGGVIERPGSRSEALAGFEAYHAERGRRQSEKAHLSMPQDGLFR